MSSDDDNKAPIPYRKRQPIPKPTAKTPATTAAAAKAATAGQLMSMELTIVFTVDNIAAFNVPFHIELPADMPDDATTAQLQIALDGRVLQQLLEPHLGIAQQQPNKLWTPPRAPGTLH